MATTPPQAPVQIQVREHHGRRFSDPYEWMRDVESEAFTSYVQAENEWTEACTRDLEPLVEEFYNDVVARTQQTDRSVPTRRRHGDRGYWYYARTIEGAEYRVHCRVRATSDTPPDPSLELDDEEVLLDGNAEAAGTDFFSLGALAVSPDGRWLAHAVDTSGDERYDLRFRDLHTGADLPDAIADITGSLAWAGNDTVYYLRADEAWRPFQVLRHRLGATGDQTEELIYTETDERFFSGLDNSTDDAWVILMHSSKLTSEVKLLPADDPEASFQVIRPREQGLLYEVEPAGDRLLVLHNQDSVDFSLAQAPLPGAGDTTQWQEVIAPATGTRLVDVEAHPSHVAVELRRDGLTAIHILSRTAEGDLVPGEDLVFDEPVHTVGLAGAQDYDTTTVRFAYTSLVTPLTIIDLDLTTGERQVRKQIPVLDHPTKGPYRPEELVQERIWATAPDGTRVPISLVRRRDTPLDGTAPALLSGYGSYEISSDPYFSTMQLSLLERGFVCATAHVRGGGELGRAWYDDGKLLHKKNTFTDFIACAQNLIDAGYTSADRLAAEGGSAGGLLMGAVVNLAPDTFAAIHAAVPFVDNLTTILMPELPLTVTEWEEWGDPLHDPEVYDYMASYSPYENVAAVQHPAILATTSLNDSRVSVVEPAKWIAALRATSRTDQRKILLRTEMVAGHGGVSGRYRAWREAAFSLAWLADQVS